MGHGIRSEEEAKGRLVDTFTRQKVVYIAGKFSGANDWEVEQNIRRAEEMSMRIAERAHSLFLPVMPLAPHKMGRFFNGTLSARYWYEGTMEYMRRSDSVLFLEDFGNSSGSRDEETVAMEVELPCFYEENIHCLWAWMDSFRQSP